MEKVKGAEANAENSFCMTMCDFDVPKLISPNTASDWHNEGVTTVHVMYSRVFRAHQS